MASMYPPPPQPVCKWNLTYDDDKLESVCSISLFSSTEQWWKRRPCLLTYFLSGGYKYDIDCFKTTEQICDYVQDCKYAEDLTDETMFCDEDHYPSEMFDLICHLVSYPRLPSIRFRVYQYISFKFSVTGEIHG
jgi:hypothetical protein